MHELGNALADPLDTGVAWAQPTWLPSPADLRAAEPWLRVDLEWIGQLNERHVAALAAWRSARARVAAIADDYDAALAARQEMASETAHTGRPLPELAPGLQAMSLPMEGRGRLRRAIGGVILRGQLAPAREELGARGELYLAVTTAVRTLWQRRSELERLAWELDGSHSPGGKTLARRLRAISEGLDGRRGTVREVDGMLVGAGQSSEEALYSFHDVMELVRAYFQGAGQAAEAALRPTDDQIAGRA